MTSLADQALTYVSITCCVLGIITDVYNLNNVPVIHKILILQYSQITWNGWPIGL